MQDDLFGDALPKPSAQAPLSQHLAPKEDSPARRTRSGTVTPIAPDDALTTLAAALPARLRRSAADIRSEIATAVEATNAASREASRVLRDEKLDKAKDKLEQSWDELKNKFKHTFS